MDNSFEYEYRQELSALHYTPEQKARIARAALYAPAQPQLRPRKRPMVRRTVLIAAAAASILVVSAAASGALKTAVEALAPIFGGEVAQTEVIDKIGRPIGASATDNGVTITADAIMGDMHNAAVVYTIRRDDGQPMLPEGVTADALLTKGSGADIQVQGGSHGSAWFTEEEDGSLLYIQTITADGAINKGTATAEFEDILYWSDAAEEPVTLAEGHWKFSFSIDYEDSSVTLGGGETFRQDDITFTVDEVTVSPFAVRTAYTADSEVQWTNAESGRLPQEDSLQMQRYMENVEILLTKTDGTVIDLSNSGGSLQPDDGKTVCTKGKVFDEIIPLEEIASVSVGGIEYPVAAK